MILGIDPGLADTGWGVIRCDGSQLSAVAYGCITTSPAQPLAARLAAIHDGLDAAIERYRPAECAIESVFFGVNARSAFATGQARGVALLATARRTLSIAEYSPVQVKSAVVGVGTAEKHQVAFMVRALLGLDHDPHPDHAADALAVAITHARLRAWADVGESMVASEETRP